MLNWNCYAVQVWTANITSEISKQQVLLVWVWCYALTMAEELSRFIIWTIWHLLFLSFTNNINMAANVWQWITTAASWELEHGSYALWKALFESADQSQWGFEEDFWSSQAAVIMFPIRHDETQLTLWSALVGFGVALTPSSCCLMVWRGSDQQKMVGTAIINVAAVK